MQIQVIYAGQRQVIMGCELEAGATIREAIESSGILRCCPEIDLNSQKVGVYGKFVKLDTPLKAGDRVEIYRRITRVLDEDDDDDED